MLAGIFAGGNVANRFNSLGEKWLFYRLICVLKHSPFEAMTAKIMLNKGLNKI